MAAGLLWMALNPMFTGIQQEKETKKEQKRRER